VKYWALNGQLDAQGRYSFEVGDTGPGIPPERHAEIFEPFRQGAEGLVKGGTGLGLAISRRYVVLMGGRLELESAAEVGARFSFNLELSPASGDVTEGSDAHLQLVSRLSPGSEVQAVVVDDVETNRDILSTMLERIGAQVRLAAGGEQALECLRQRLPDIVFLDIRMPGMDGPKVLEHILKEYGSDAVKVVGVSASVLEHQRQRVLDAGFDDFISKPLRAERLFACMTKLLGVHYEYTREPDPPATDTPAPELSSISLPGDLLDALRQAVSIQSITRLRRHLDDLEELGDEARQLATHLRELSQRYDLKAIGAALEKFSNE